MARGLIIAAGLVAAGTLGPGLTASAVAHPLAAQADSSALTVRQAGCVAQLDADLDTGERVGQLIWVSLDHSLAPAGVDSLVRYRHLGGVVLLGGYHDGVSATAVTTAHLHGLSDPRVRVAVAADQEGGYVQQLQGPGFSTIPTAYDQGRSYGPSTTLANLTTRWGGQLHAAGIDVNLAPVADTVARDFMPDNAPIGHWLRNYDTTASRVAADVPVVVKGFRAGGVATTVKHFPGLGRITDNTDTSSTGITDTVTSPSSAYLDPFAAGIRAGASFVMVSSAWYPRIDPANQAVFSQATISGLLRGRLGYAGTVISDDVGNAEAVAAVPVGSRATRFIISGGDIVLTADPATVDPMVRAIEKARASSPTFKARLDAAVRRVLVTKTALGMTRCS